MWMPPVPAQGGSGARTLTPQAARHAITEMAAYQARTSFRTFCRRAWTVLLPDPPIWSWHMDALCEHLSFVTLGEIRFLMIGIPPRHSKTMLASVLWPAWHWLHKPGEQFLTAMLDYRLSSQSAVLSRRLIESNWWRLNFGDEIEIYDDENQVGCYRNTGGGYRQIASVQGGITGLGGSIQIGDDFHDAKKVESDAVRLGTIGWHDNAFRSRLNNPETAQKVYIGQRTHEQDVYGHVIEQEGNRWVVVNLPLEFNPKARCVTYLNRGEGPDTTKEIFHDPRTIEGEILDPKRFSAKTAAAEKAIMSEAAWEAQYNQAPQGQGGFILKRAWWRPWVHEAWRGAMAGKERPLPQFSEVIQVYDTAFEEDEEADFTARVTLGFFQFTESLWDEKLQRAVQGQTRTCAMLLEMMFERMTFPDLREDAIQHHKDFEPDRILIEKKASGHDLVHELRRKHLPVVAVGLKGSGRGAGQADLVTRAHTASLMLQKGCVFYPVRPWANQLIEMTSKFPNGPPGSRDLVSALTMGLMYGRRYYDLELPDDERDEINPYAWKQRRARRYV